MFDLEDTHDCRAIRASVNLIVEEAVDLVLPQEKKICHRMYSFHRD